MSPLLTRELEEMPRTYSNDELDGAIVMIVRD